MPLINVETFLRGGKKKLAVLFLKSLLQIQNTSQIRVLSHETTNIVMTMYK